MVDFKGTPGPWELDVDSGTIINHADVVVANIEMQPIARGGETYSTADGYLIAAAPDLLAACAAVVETDGFAGSGIMRRRIDAMRAAIAKARYGRELWARGKL